MKISQVPAALVVLLALCVLAGAQVSNQPGQPGDAETLRQILVNQPNYTAVQQFIFSEGFGGFGAGSRVARLGNRYREESDDRIFINEPGKPTIRIYPKRKEYSEQPAEKDIFQFTPHELAGRNDVTLKSLGKEKVGGYDCLKIEVTYRDEKLKGMVFVFYAAPALKNLVIREEISLGEQVRFVTQLSDVSFNVSENLFLIPAGYKKIVEPSAEEEMDQLLRRIKTPPDNGTHPTPP
ncbi:MAG TPA: DUF4412 domain-containing protein [Blastocatellia bacterium]